MGCAVLGPRGTFSEEAARVYWGKRINLSTAQDIPELFGMLIKGEVDDILVPIDNTQAGSIDVSIRCLQEYPVCIKGEIMVPIRQQLMAAGKYHLDEIELLISQPAALMQCCDFIGSNLKGVRTEISSSTAKAVQIISTEPRKAAAIGSRQAAGFYGLKLIAENIQNHDNFTRFVHIRPKGEDVYQGEKASIIIALPDNPGTLLKALEIFAVQEINLSKIESRPDRMKRGKFNFYIEMDVSCGSERLIKALDNLKEYCSSVKYLGAYDKRMEDYVC